jgi:predicted Zn-dependent protease with MMP-like domain
MARQAPAMKLSEKAFDKAVRRAIRRIPEEIRQHLDNTMITVRKRPSRNMLVSMNLPPDQMPLGVFWGASRLDQSETYPSLYPNTIFIFQEPLEDLCETIGELEEQIEITVVHEIAHFLGMDEERLHELGYG